MHLAGKSTLKDWKRAIRMNGIMLRWAGRGAGPERGWGGARDRMGRGQRQGGAGDRREGLGRGGPATLCRGALWPLLSLWVLHFEDEGHFLHEDCGQRPQGWAAHTPAST